PLAQERALLARRSARDPRLAAEERGMTRERELDAELEILDEAVGGGRHGPGGGPRQRHPGPHESARKPQSRQTRRADQVREAHPERRELLAGAGIGRVAL